MSWQDYVDGLVGEMPNRVASARSGVTEATISRWRSGGIKSPDARQVASFARGYDRPVLEAFIAAGFLEPEEARQRPSAPPSLTTLTDELATVPWISPQYYQRRFPDEYARQAVFYLGFSLVQPQARDKPVLFGMLHAIPGRV